MGKPTLLVLAAGMGSRYGGLKQIDPIGPNGEIIIDYSIFDAIRAGFGKIVFIIRREIEKDFKECIGNRFKNIIPVEYAFQEIDVLPGGFRKPEGRTKPWGTGHAILSAKEYIHENFCVINADDFYSRAGFETIGKYLQTAEDKNNVADFAMVGYPLKRTLTESGTVSRGVCKTDSNGILTEIIERTKIAKKGNAAVAVDDPENPIDLTGEEPVSMNLWGFTPSFFNVLEKGFIEFLEKRGTEMKSEYFIALPIMDVINDGTATVKVLNCDAQWFGITYPEDKPIVVNAIQKLIEDGVYPSKLF